MDEWKKWLGRWWFTMGLAAFAVSSFMRWSDSELAQSEAMKTLDNTLMVIMVPLTLVLIVVRNVEVYRQRVYGGADAAGGAGSWVRVCW